MFLSIHPPHLPTKHACDAPLMRGHRYCTYAASRVNSKVAKSTNDRVRPFGVVGAGPPDPARISHPGRARRVSIEIRTKSREHSCRCIQQGKIMWMCYRKYTEATRRSSKTHSVTESARGPWFPSWLGTTRVCSASSEVACLFILGKKSV